MVLDEDWRTVVADPDMPTERPRGRAVVRIAGRLSLVQIPDLPSPVDRPDAESLYPVRRSEPAQAIGDTPWIVPPVQMNPCRETSDAPIAGRDDGNNPPQGPAPTRPPRRSTRRTQ
jgi:hypothetical protein